MSDCVFCNDTATTEIYTLSLHDALPIYLRCTLAQLEPDPGHQRPVAHRHHHGARKPRHLLQHLPRDRPVALELRDRKSTRLNSSHANISYAVFCLKKKKAGKPMKRSITI